MREKLTATFTGNIITNRGGTMMAEFRNGPNNGSTRFGKLEFELVQDIEMYSEGEYVQVCREALKALQAHKQENNIEVEYPNFLERNDI